MAAEFIDFDVLSQADFAINIEGVEFMPDWWLLAHCDAIAISNSTFSLTAAMLNQQLQVSVRPSLSCNALRDFDPWNTAVLESRNC